MLTHGTAIALRGRGILLTGPSGAGKTDLALRAISAGAHLIADDAVDIRLIEGRLCAALPKGARPLMAVREIGIVPPARAVDSAPLALCVSLERVAPPAPLAPQLGAAGPWHGHHVPEIRLDPFDASILVKLELALERYGH